MATVVKVYDYFEATNGRKGERKKEGFQIDQQIEDERLPQ